MEKRQTEPKIGALVVGIIIGAIGGMLIGFIVQWWGLAIAFAVGFVIVWYVAQRLWMRRADKEIEDPYDGR